MILELLPTLTIFESWYLLTKHIIINNIRFQVIFQSCHFWQQNVANQFHENRCAVLNSADVKVINSGELKILILKTFSIELITAFNHES